MKKKLIDFTKKTLMSCVIATMWTSVQAQVPLSPVVEPGSYGSPTITSTGDACLSYTGSTGVNQNFTLSGTGLKSGTISYNWTVIGGINLVSTSGATATIAPFLDSKGRYNKGRLKVLYKGLIDSVVTVNSCPSCNGVPVPPQNVTIQVPKSGIIYVDVYQKFDYSSDKIVGNVCVTTGDSNAYSIKDLVSGNIKDGIGIDSYYWNFKSIVSKITGGQESYVSGDSSAITFLFTANPNGGEQIKVNVGRCNLADSSTKQRIKVLAPKLPKATHSSIPTCIPTSTHQVTISNTTRTGIIYKWVLTNPNYTFTGGTNANSQSFVTVDIGSQAGVIYLVSAADPTGPYCSDGTITDTIKIKRSLDTDVVIDGSICVTPGSYKYTLDPNPNTPLNWVFPDGWSIVAGNEHASIVPVTVTTNAVSGTIKAVSADCTDDTIKLDVQVAPLAPGPIIGDTCLTKGTNKTFKINKVLNATSYTWTYPSGFTAVGATNDTSLTLTVGPSAVSGDITVVANGCAGATASSKITVNFAPTRPGTITRSPSTCINRGMADTITFTAANCVGGQTYEWITPPGWTKVAPINACSLTVYTDGVTGTGFIVKARGVNSCDKSVYDSISVDIIGVGAINITPSPIMDEDDNQVGEVFTATNVILASYQWFQDGNPIDGETTRNLFLEGTTAAELCVRVSKGGCMTQRCRNSIYANSLRQVNAPAETTYNGKVKLYPNPASDVLKIVVPGKFSKAGVSIVDAHGTEVYNQSDISAEETSINVSKLIAGTYYVLLNVDGQSINKKIQIVK